MQKRYSFFLLLGCCVLCLSALSCGDSNNKKKESESYLEKHSAIFAQKLDLNQLSKTKLTPEAKRASDNWIEYLTVKSEIERFGNYTLQDLIANKGNIAKTIERLQDSVIDPFQVIPVEARINVLLTKAKVLNQYAERSKIDAGNIEGLGQDIAQAFYNLNIQLNEVFYKRQRDFQFDMDARQDSVLKAKKN